MESKINQAHKLEIIHYFCNHCDNGRGIWKRIDENREILQYLQENNILEEHPFLEVWLWKQDEFLGSLCNLLELPYAKDVYFPRKWTGKYQPMYVNFSLDEIRSYQECFKINDSNISE